MAGQAGPSGQRNLPDDGVHQQQAEAVPKKSGQEPAAAGASSAGRRLLLGPAAAEAAAGGEENECRICYNLFDPERHAPKLLECLHTFCLQCLRQLHLRAAASRQAGGTEDHGGDAGAIVCPLCRHLTVVPGGRVENLLLNTKLVKAKPFARARGGGGGGGGADLHPRLPLETLASARQRPLPEHGGGSLTPATAATGEPEAERGCRPAARFCCVVILFFVGMFSGAMAVYCVLRGLHDSMSFLFLPVSMFVSLSCFLFICSIVRGYSRNAPGGTGGRGGRRPRHHFVREAGEDTRVPMSGWGGEGLSLAAAEPHWCGYSVASPYWGGHAPDPSASHVESGWGGCDDLYSGVSSAGCGFSECNVDSGVSSGGCEY